MPHGSAALTPQLPPQVQNTTVTQQDGAPTVTPNVGATTVMPHVESITVTPQVGATTVMPQVGTATFLPQPETGTQFTTPGVMKQDLDTLLEEITAITMKDVGKVARMLALHAFSNDVRYMQKRMQHQTEATIQAHSNRNRT